MTAAERQTIRECAEATRLHLDHLTKRLTEEQRTKLFDDILEGMSITATKLETIGESIGTKVHRMEPTTETGYMGEFVGWLIPTKDGKHTVIGKCCESERAKRKDADTPIMRVNIFPYNQHCAICGNELVRGQSTTWPELFDGKLGAAQEALATTEQS